MSLARPSFTASASKKLHEVALSILFQNRAQSGFNLSKSRSLVVQILRSFSPGFRPLIWIF